MTDAVNDSDKIFDNDEKSMKVKNSICNKCFRFTTIKDMITMLSSILVPVVLGVFTILSTYNQLSMENTRSKQQSELESERHQQQIAMNLDKYRNDLLVDYIEKMGTMLEKHNFSLTHDADLAALARAKTLSTISQLDPIRIIQIVRFLYETRLIAHANQREVLDLSKSNLSGVTSETFSTYKKHGRLALNGILINNTAFNNILLENVDLASAKLTNINFSSTSFAYRDESWVSRQTTIIHHVNFHSAHLYKVDYFYVELKIVVFDKAHLQDISYYGSRLLEIFFRELNAVNVVFERANLQNVSFWGAELLEISFKEVNAVNVVFEKAQLQNTSFRGAKLLDLTFRETNMLDVDFSFARLVLVSFSGAQMKRVNFTQAVLYHVVFDDHANMTDVYFDQAVFYNVTFTKTKLENIRFVSAAFFSGSFFSSQLFTVNFSRTLRTFVNFTQCLLINIDFSYSNLKRSRFHEFWQEPNALYFFRTNLQYASLDDYYLHNLTIFATSYKHNARLWGGISRDPNLLLSSKTACEKQIPDKWQVESGDELVVNSNQLNGTCRFSLKSNIKRTVLSQSVSLNGIWEHDIWPISYGIISAFMSEHILIELLGIDRKGTILNSVLINSNDTDARRMRLYKNMHKITVKIYFTTDNYTSNVSDIWCDEPYLVIEYGTKQDLHSSLHSIPSDAEWSKKEDVIMEHLSDYVFGLTIDQESGTVFVADTGNNRIVSWTPGEQGKREVAQNLNYPTDVVIDKDTNSLIISELGKKRIIRWFLQSDINQSETIINNTICRGLAIDDEGTVYTADLQKNEVRRYPKRNKIGELVAGQDGRGTGLNQLDDPFAVTVDSEGALFVSDYKNHRVVKWNRETKESVVIAGSGGQGSNNTQLYFPNRILIDANDNLYVADHHNHRVVRYKRNEKIGDTLVDGLNHPYALAFDNRNNLYVADYSRRVLRFDIT